MFQITGSYGLITGFVPVNYGFLRVLKYKTWFWEPKPGFEGYMARKPGFRDRSFFLRVFDLQGWSQWSMSWLFCICIAKLAANEN